MTEHRVTPSGVHVEDTGGDGRTLLLVHGGFCDSPHWRHQVGPLSAAGHRVITLDLPGHGRSARTESFAVAGMAAAVLDVVHRAGADGYVLVGHSYGSRIVLDAADREPSAVAGVVVDGSRAGTRSDDGAVLGALRAKGTRRFVRTPYLDLLERTLDDVTVQVVPGIGHFTMLEAPDAVTSALAASAR